MTYLQMVNKVLIRMREAQVASVSESDYSLLIGEFVQQALSEVEDARDWNSLRTTIAVTTVKDSYSYTLTSAGYSYNILCVFEDTEDYEVHKAPSYAWMNQRLLDNDVETDQPTYYDINGVDGAGDPIVNFYPVPDAVYTVNFNMKIKSVLNSDSAGSPLDPLPVILKATMLAVDERGDDAGLSLQVLEGSYQTALANAVMYDAVLNEDEAIWEVE